MFAKAKRFVMPCMSIEYVATQRAPRVVMHGALEKEYEVSTTIHLGTSGSDAHQRPHPRQTQQRFLSAPPCGKAQRKSLLRALRPLA